MKNQILTAIVFLVLAMLARDVWAWHTEQPSIIGLVQVLMHPPGRAQ